MVQQGNVNPHGLPIRHGSGPTDLGEIGDGDAIAMRSFELVEDKLFEADFFLMELAASGSNVFRARCCLSAFVSAARSVTFAMQASLADLPGFRQWYEDQQNYLREAATARFFVQARNDSQKLGLYHINAGAARRGTDGNLEHKHYFLDDFHRYPDCPKEDIQTASRQYLTLLVQVVYACFEHFGPQIDPAQYYTLDNLRALRLSIEDVEESLGFPRGWTAVGSDEERIRALSAKLG